MFMGYQCRAKKEGIVGIDCKFKFRLMLLSKKEIRKFFNLD